jgi:hypothetical protein
LLPDVDRAPLQGPFASSPGLARMEGSLLSPIPGLFPFPNPAVVLGVVPAPKFGKLLGFGGNDPLYIPPALPPTPCADAEPLEKANEAASAVIMMICIKYSLLSYQRIRSARMVWS